MMTLQMCEFWYINNIIKEQIKSFCLLCVNIFCECSLKLKLDKANLPSKGFARVKGILHKNSWMDVQDERKLSHPNQCLKVKDKRK